jgi:hypothetical protein
MNLRQLRFTFYVDDSNNFRYYTFADNYTNITPNYPIIPTVSTTLTFMDLANIIPSISNLITLTINITTISSSHVIIGPNITNTTNICQITNGTIAETITLPIESNGFYIAKSDGYITINSIKINGFYIAKN